MHAHGRIEYAMQIRHANARFQIRRSVAGSDRHHPLHAGLERALDHRVRSALNCS